MIGFSHYPLHKAIYDTLVNDGALMGMITGVFDRAEQEQVYPYIVIGESAVTDWSTSTTTGTEHRFRINVWSREGGKRETELVMERVYILLHDVALNVGGHNLISIRFLSSDITLESDGWTYAGGMRYRVLLEAV